MPSLFVYGTLLSHDVLLALLARVPSNRPAVLHQHIRRCVRGEAFPAIIRTGCEAHRVDGLLLEGLLPKEVRAVDYYEDEEYEKLPVNVHTPAATADSGIGDGGEQLVTAQAYVWPATLAEQLDLEQEWNLADFLSRDASSFVSEVVVPCREEFEAVNPLPCTLQEISSEQVAQLHSRSLDFPTMRLPRGGGKDVHIGAFTERHGAPPGLVAALSLELGGKDERDATLTALSVEAEHQGRRVGSALFAQAGHLARVAGCRRLRCGVPEEHRVFFEKNGMSAEFSNDSEGSAQYYSILCKEFH